jgi:PEP-CTERM motif
LGPAGGFPGSTFYNFSFTGGYAPGALPIGTYFHFGDLDSSSAESYRLRAFDTSSNLILTPWLETPFAATSTAVVGDMPSYSFSPGVYDFNGTTISSNPTISVFLKNNTAIGFLELTRTATTTAFTLAAPPTIPEPSTMLLLVCGAAASTTLVRRRQRA